MSISQTIISIGTLSRNRLWGETAPRRAAHATTTLIRDGNTTILVDPGLPIDVLAQRLDERTGLRPEQIEVVFLTTFRPVHRRGLAGFSKAAWLMHAPEIEAMRAHLDQLAAGADHAHDGCEHGHSEVADLVRQEGELLGRFRPAGERLSRQVHLYPLVGASPGSAGLLVAEAARTTIVAGDAVLTREHFDAAQVYEQAYDIEAAQESFRELLEVADAVVPGHDNWFLAAGR